MTLRQLFYRLVSTEKLKNYLGDYKKLSRVTSRARENGDIPFEWLADRSRPEYEPYVFDDAREYLTVMSRNYRRNYWRDQPAHVELWSEKDTLTGSIQPLLDEFGVVLRTLRGFSSVTRAHEIAQLFAELNAQGKRIYPFFLGDHDASGRCIEKELCARVRHYGSGPFQIRRLAIHAGDIAKFHLPPLRVKLSDSRARAFVAKYAQQCVEVDALPPTELRRRIREAIMSVLDMDRWARAVEIEKVECSSIRDIVARWPRIGEGHQDSSTK